MKKMITTALIFSMVLAGMVISGCTDSEPAGQPYTPAALQSTAVDVTIGEVLSNPYAYDTVSVTGTVNRTSNIGDYIFVEITDGTDSMWVAGYSAQLENGSQITATGIINTQFYSPTLDMTFDVLVLADKISDGSGQLSGSPHGSDNNVEIGEINVTSVEGGTTIEEILADSASLSGQEVKVSAVVVKSVGLIDEQFLTLEDGTGNQLKGRCPDTFALSTGQKVVVTGTVMTEVDLGSGYYYEVLLQITDVE